MSNRELEVWQKNLLDLANFIEKAPDTLFDMSHVFVNHECCSPGCVIGHGLWKYEVDHNLSLHDKDTTVENWLHELFNIQDETNIQDQRNLEEWHKLTMPDNWNCGKKLYPKSRVLKVLRHFALTGKVEYDKFPV